MQTFIQCIKLFFQKHVLVFPKQKNPPTLAIFCYKTEGFPPWDPRTIQTGIAGAEESVIYIAKELSRLGYQVTIFANPPQNSPYSAPTANPRYLSSHHEDSTYFDIAISWRMVKMGPKLKKRAKKVYLWPHDICSEVWHKSQIKSFDDVLWLSQFEKEQYSLINPLFSSFPHVFFHGIEPAQCKGVKERQNPHSCIYGSNYTRGLEILLDIWPLVHKEYPKATLDIYYGWQKWGRPAFEKEQKMREQIEKMRSYGVLEHGCVGHEELNAAYEKASLWTYPCTYPETFCVSALRAQVSGAIPVIIDGSALRETVLYGYRCGTKEEYLPLLLLAMKESAKISLETRKKTSEQILAHYSWKRVAERWHELFQKA